MPGVKTEVSTPREVDPPGGPGGVELAEIETVGGSRLLGGVEKVGETVFVHVRLLSRAEEFVGTGLLGGVEKVGGIVLVPVRLLSEAERVAEVVAGRVKLGAEGVAEMVG